jgi:RNA polymerase II C-terminal domain phosphatase-like 1/2
MFADKYLSTDPNKMIDMRENGVGSNRNLFEYSGDDLLPISCTSEESHFMKLEENNSRKNRGPVAALKELVSSCMPGLIINTLTLFSFIKQYVSIYL